MEQRKILGVRVFIWALLSVLIQIPNVMGDEVKDISIDESTTVERRGHGDMALPGMENDRLKTKGAYQELEGLPSKGYCGASLNGMSYNKVVLVSPDVKLRAVQRIFDKDIYNIGSLFAIARRGCVDMAPRGMENYRLDKKDWSKDEYFNSVNTNGAYQELRGLPRQWCFDHLSDGVSYTKVCLLPRDIESVDSVQYIFDKAIYANYCTSGTEKGIAVTFLFVDGEVFRNRVEKYYEKTGVVPTGVMLSPATNTQHEEFLEYMTTKLSKEKVGVVTKVLLESDSSYEQEGRNLEWFLKDLLDAQYKSDFVAALIECIPSNAITKLPKTL